jgi:hypothetical protein
VLADVCSFDIAAEKWSKLETKGDRPQSRGWFDADVVKGKEGKEVIVVHDGLAQDSSRLGDVWIMEFE